MGFGVPIRNSVAIGLGGVVSISAVKTVSDIPYLLGAVISEDGTTLTMVFSENVYIGAGGNTGFTISASGGAATLTYSSGGV